MNNITLLERVSYVDVYEHDTNSYKNSFINHTLGEYLQKYIYESHTLVNTYKNS